MSHPGAAPEPLRQDPALGVSVSLAGPLSHPATSSPRWEANPEAPLSFLLPLAALVPRSGGPWAAPRNLKWLGRKDHGRLPTISLIRLGLSPDCVQGLVLPT